MIAKRGKRVLDQPLPVEKRSNNADKEGVGGKGQINRTGPNDQLRGGRGKEDFPKKRGENEKKKKRVSLKHKKS